MTKFIPQQKNANKHTLHGTRLLEKSVTSDGWIDAQTSAADGEMISGTARLELAEDKFAGVEPIVIDSDGTRPVIIRRTDIPDLNDPRAKRLSIAANQIAHTDLDFDGDLLKEWGNEDAAIKAMFAESEWTEITGEEKPTVDAEPQIDRAAELLEKWQVKSGDLWQIGLHRLICGDCTDAAVVARVMGGEKADMVFTSPPYNGNTTMYDYIVVDGKKKRKDKTLYTDNETDNKTSQEYIDFCHNILGLCFDNTKGFIFWNINYNANSRHEYIDSIYPFRDRLQETIIWKKNAIPTANGFTRNFEFIFMFKTDEDLGHLNKEYDVIHTLWDVNNSGSQEQNHKACFPVELPQKAIAISEKMILIFDPFCGSGTTLVACENLSRRGRAIEISPSYVAVTLQRMADAFPELIIKRIE